MSRKKKRIFRNIFPDIFYNSTDVEKFINIIMISGKKTIARNIVYKAFNYIKNFYKKDPIIVFSKALDNCAPLIEFKTNKMGNINKNNFIEIKKFRRESLSMRLIKKFASLRKEKFMYLRLANELLDSFKKKSESFKKRESIHKVSDSKRNYKRK